MSKVYIAGKMRGVPFYNFLAFDVASARLRRLGFTPLSPADMDRLAGFHADRLPADTDWNVLPDGFDLDAALARDNAAIDDSETVAIYVIHDGFADSTGATAEVERGMRAGKIILFDTMDDDRILRATARSLQPGALPPNEEIRYVDPKTGGMKGEKLARFDLLPPDILWELAEHYGHGSKKYGDRNMEKGYPWSKSFAACQRHLNQFWRGEDNDAEFGSLHLVAAAWHCFTMAWFLRHNKGTDDRPKGAIVDETNGVG